MKRKILWKKYKNPLISVNQDGEEDEKGKIILKETPFGIQALKINPEALDELQWWVGHTNFDIDEQIKDIIDDTDGVEVLNVFSAYRFRVAIGKNFNVKKVLRNITTVLCRENFLINPDIYNRISQDISKIDPSKEWLVYILPNDTYEIETASSADEIIDKAKLYDGIKNILGGTIITS